IFMPDRAFVALKGSAYILTRIAVALSIVFVLIFALNLFIKPGHLSRLFSKGFGIKEVALSVFAGIVSIGPIYAWYPLLKDLKSKGVRDSLLAVFLNCRSVKPVLLPVMISYFGWHYVLIFTVAMVLGSLLCGLIVEMLSGQ
ncbi:MAG: permease, partial [Deltaproteobacteria bacterium]